MYVYILLLLIIAHAKTKVTANELVLPYTTVAYTRTGKPCIGGCSPETHQCVASRPPKNEPCILHCGNQVSRFLTTQARSQHKYCLSNCGNYGTKYAWCYVTKDGKWDNCTSQRQITTNPSVSFYNMIAYTTAGKPCIGGCSTETRQCVASWPPKNEPCVAHCAPVSRLPTTQARSQHKLCLSNCGYYGSNMTWCYVTDDGEWDYCTPKKQITTNALVLPYTMVANTTTGKPCIGGCSPETHQCVASWPPKNEPCVLHSTPIYRFLTTQAKSKHKYCLSNCGYYNSAMTPWCYVTKDGKWDYCTLQEQMATNVLVSPYIMVAYTTTGKPCIGGCSPETQQCVSSWPPKNEPCVLHSTNVSSFLTTQARSQHKYCLSNCVYYGWKNAWCYVTNDGQWDYCTPQKQMTINALVLPYTMVADTTTGKPCIGGCSPETFQCVASRPPKNYPCVLRCTPVSRFLTTQAKSQHKYCLSNCGNYGSKTAWCYVTNDGQWDYCTPKKEMTTNAFVVSYRVVAYTTTGKPCIGGCTIGNFQCVASWPPKNEPCVAHCISISGFLTTQAKSHHKYCLSNCGYFGTRTAWCYVTRDGEWDYCIPQEIESDNRLVLSNTTVAYSTTEKPCIGDCSSHSSVHCKLAT